VIALTGDIIGTARMDTWSFPLRIGKVKSILNQGSTHFAVGGAPGRVSVSPLQGVSGGLSAVRGGRAQRNTTTAKENSLLLQLPFTVCAN
jgi:hypothetical protein